MVKICYFLSYKLTFTRPHVFLTLSCTLLTLQWSVLFYSLNDRTQSAGSFLEPCCLVSTDIHNNTFLYVLGNGTVCVPRSVCVSRTPLVYMWSDDLNKWNKKYYKLHLSGVACFPSMGSAMTQNTNTPAHTNTKFTVNLNT